MPPGVRLPSKEQMRMYLHSNASSGAASAMGSHLIWQKYSCIGVPLANKLSTKAPSYNKMQSCKVNSSCSACYLGFECARKACVYLLCCLAIIFNQCSMIGLCHLALCRPCLTFSWCFVPDFCLNVNIFIFP